MKITSRSHRKKADDESAIIASWIYNYFDNVMTKFMTNNRTEALKTDVNLLNIKEKFRKSI